MLLRQPEQIPARYGLGSRGNMMLSLLPSLPRDAQQESVQYWHGHGQQHEAAARQDKLGKENHKKIDSALLSKCAVEIDGF